MSTKSGATEDVMHSDDVAPSEHNGANPKPEESGRLVMEWLCTEIGMCGVVEHCRCDYDHITLRATE